MAQAKSKMYFRITLKWRTNYIFFFLFSFFFFWIAVIFDFSLYVAVKLNRLISCLFIVSLHCMSFPYFKHEEPQTLSQAVCTEC